MNTSEKGDHWQFALACAINQLHLYVHAFDFAAELSGHAAYVGISPDYLINVINGFLSEENLVPGGTITQLTKLRAEIEEKIIPAYKAGRMDGHRVWSSTDSLESLLHLMFTAPEEVMSLAKTNVPSTLSDSEANWFVEGFCHIWAMEGFAVHAIDTVKEWRSIYADMAGVSDQDVNRAGAFTKLLSPASMLDKVVWLIKQFDRLPQVGETLRELTSIAQFIEHQVMPAYSAGYEVGSHFLTEEHAANQEQIDVSNSTDRRLAIQECLPTDYTEDEISWFIAGFQHALYNTTAY